MPNGRRRWAGNCGMSWARHIDSMQIIGLGGGVIRTSLEAHFTGRRIHAMSVPDWRLPRGVSGSVWEFAHDRGIACDENRHLADAPLLEFDRRIVAGWFATPG